MPQREDFTQKREAQQKLRRQRLIQSLTLMGFLIMLLIAFISYRSYNVKKKANELLSGKNAQISEQKEELVQINKQLKQSEQEIREANRAGKLL